MACRLQRIFGNVTYTLSLSYASYPELYFHFLTRVFIFDTMIACDMSITTNVSDHRYNLELKGQGHIYLNWEGHFVCGVICFQITPTKRDQQLQTMKHQQQQNHRLKMYSRNIYL